MPPLRNFGCSAPVINANMLLFLFLLLPFSFSLSERTYTLRVDGCGEQEYTLSELEGIRDSQKDVWEELGTEQPWWSVLSSSENAGKRDLAGDELASFYASGDLLVSRALRTVDSVISDRNFLPWTSGGVGAVAVDFGCGVGRLSKALAQRFFSVLCVDHSRRHLDAGRIALEKNDKSVAERVLMVHSTKAAADIENKAQFALSALALQHMIPQLQAAALEHLCDSLKITGTGFLQLLTHYDDAPYVTAGCDPQRAIAEPGMHLHYLPLNEAIRHLHLRGCDTLHTEVCDDFVTIPQRNSSAHCLVFLKARTSSLD